MHRTRLIFALPALLACAAVFQQATAEESDFQRDGAEQNQSRDVRIIPGDFSLSGIESRQLLSVVGVSGGRIAAQSVQQQDRVVVLRRLFSLVDLRL